MYSSFVNVAVRVSHVYFHGFLRSVLGIVWSKVIMSLSSMNSNSPFILEDFSHSSNNNYWSYSRCKSEIDFPNTAE